METQRNQRSPLQSDRGTMTINDAVVVSIAGVAVREVSGAEMEVEGTRLPGDTSPTVGELFGSLTGSGRGARGVLSRSAIRRRPWTLRCRCPTDGPSPR